MKKPLTLYSFGYWGWGNATEQLVAAVDAVDRRRGFRPPLFVDIRIRRNVRAVGFRDDAFKVRFGSRRYRWMPALGNRRVAQGRGGIKIDDPAVANELLTLALDCAKQRRHAIFFCSCEFPDGCHRSTVAALLLKEARKRGTAIEVVEWPGGEPRAFVLQALDRDVPRDTTSRLYLPKGCDLADYGGLALGTLVTANGVTRSRTVAVATAMYAKKGWYLPVLQDGRGRVIPGRRRDANAWRKWGGYQPRSTGLRMRS